MFSACCDNGPGEQDKGANLRVPLKAHEVEITRRMDVVLGLPVTKIALAVNRNKNSVYAALGGDWATEARGRKELLTKVQVQGNLWPPEAHLGPFVLPAMRQRHHLENL